MRHEESDKTYTKKKFVSFNKKPLPQDSKRLEVWLERYIDKKLTTEEANKVFFEILNAEKANGMNSNAYESATKEFNSRYQRINWTNYYESSPFEYSSNSLYTWSPIADELKKLDKKIVLNSMILKWDNVKKEFIDIINI